MQKKFHINDNEEAKRCRADKRKCRFGGKNGEENHFFTMEEAEAEIRRRHAKTSNDFKTLSKKNTNNKTASVDGTLKRLRQTGAVVNKINSVSTHDFSGGNPETSSIDVLDEKMDPKLLKAIEDGELQLF